MLRTITLPKGEAQSQTWQMIELLDQRARFFDAKRIACDNCARLPTLYDVLQRVEDPGPGRLGGSVFWLDDKWIGFSGFGRIRFRDYTVVPASPEEWTASPRRHRVFIDNIDQNGPTAINVCSGSSGVGLRILANCGFEVGIQVALVGPLYPTQACSVAAMQLQLALAHCRS